MMTIKDMEMARTAVAILRARDKLPWWAFIRRNRLMERARRIALVLHARDMP
jgi:hypothetical protein